MRLIGGNITKKVKSLDEDFYNIQNTNGDNGKVLSSGFNYFIYNNLERDLKVAMTIVFSVIRRKLKGW
jgi:hypothetical protein